MERDGIVNCRPGQGNKYIQLCIQPRLRRITTKVDELGRRVWATRSRFRPLLFPFFPWQGRSEYLHLSRDGGVNLYKHEGQGGGFPVQR